MPKPPKPPGKPRGFVARAIEARVVPIGNVVFLAQPIAGVSWKPIPNFQIDRSKPFPQYINAIRATYLVDPGGRVASVTLVDV